MADEARDTSSCDAMRQVISLLDEALDLLNGAIDDPNIIVNLELVRLEAQDELARSP